MPKIYGRPVEYDLPYEERMAHVAKRLSLFLKYPDYVFAGWELI